MYTSVQQTLQFSSMTDVCLPPLHSQQFGHSWDVKVNQKYVYASQRLVGDQGQGSAFGPCS
jgi:hypothetical protein